MIGRCVSVTLIAMAATVSSAATFHVAVTGSDQNPGTSRKPWGSLHHAAAMAKAGDQVIVHGGTYRLTKPLEFKNSGSEKAWIEFAGAPRQEVVIDAVGIRPKDLGEAASFGAISVIGPSYLRLKNLTLKNSYGFGFLVRGPSHHIDIQECRVDKTFAPGIGAWNAKAIRVVGCEVTNATVQEMRLYGDPNHEPPHEAISIAGVDGFEVAWNHVHHCGKEGIDVKEISRNGTVHHNYVHHMPRQGLYVDAWFGLLENVEFYSNVVHDSEWGFVVSVEGKGSELRNVRAHHNVLYRNRGSGIYFGTWGEDLLRTGVVLAHNTIYNNGKPVHWAGPTGSIDLRSKSSQNISVINNLCAGGGAFDFASFINPATELARFDELKIRVSGNLFQSLKDDTAAPSPYGKVYAWRGINTVVADPRMRNPEAGDFTLRPDSPAINAGDPGTTDPDGSRADIGAFPRGAKKLPPPRAHLKDFPPYKPKPKGWPSFLMP
jgi:hypothetical protein